MLERSKKMLVGVHPDLVRLMEAADIDVPAKLGYGFIITEGRRTLERQKYLLSIGATWTLNSRHLTGHAVDIAAWNDKDHDNVVDGNEILWHWPLYQQMYGVILDTASRLGIKIVWGGSWEQRDGPHYELDRKYYQ